MLRLRQNEGGQPRPRVLVRFPEKPLEFIWVTAIEHPEQPGATLWVEEEELEYSNSDIEPVGRAAELKKSADAYFASIGTKNDSWTCMICGQWDDHWPPMCPNKHLCPELELQPIMGPSCGNHTPAAGDSLVDVDHWQCRICGEMDNHWPALCPYRYLNSIFDIYRGNRAGTSTYVPPGLGPAKGGDVFCRICGGMDHAPAICKHKHLVKEFKGTPPPIVTISKDNTPEPSSPRPCLLSSDYLVVPDIFDHVGGEREAAGGGLEQVEFFNSLGEMIHFIREANKKSKQTGKSMAERPIVVGGAVNRRLHQFEYCIVCCKYTDHPCFLCPYKQFVPPGEKVGPGCVLVCCLCGTEDCRMHQQRRAAPIVCFVCGAMFDHRTGDCTHSCWRWQDVSPQL